MIKRLYDNPVSWFIAAFAAIIFVSAVFGGEEPTPHQSETYVENYIVRLPGDWGWNEPSLVSFEYKDCKIEVVYRQSSNQMYLTYPPSREPDKIWKEVYVADGDKIVLKEKVYGKIIPAREVPETIEW